MLLPDDHRLIESEPDLPGVAVVLDPTALLDRLGPVWGAGDAADAEVTYLRHKPGTSLVVGLLVREADGGTHLAHAVAHRLDSPEKLHKLRAAGTGPGTGRGVAVDHGLGVALVDAAADRHLPGVRRLLGGPGSFDALVYKPARRWVAVQHPPVGPPSLTKIHRPSRTRAHLTGHRLLQGTGLPVARLLKARPKDGRITTEFVPGVAMDRVGVLAEAALAETAGELLAALHAVRASGDGVEVDRDTALAAAVAAVRSAVPEAVPQAREVAESVRAALSGRTVRTLVHGDFSADQLIVRPDLAVTGEARSAKPAVGGATSALPRQAPLTLVDLDRVGVDDPLADLACWAAAEIAAGRAGGSSDPMIVLGPVLAGYTASGGAVDERALTALTAGALLQRAVEPFRTHSPDWSTGVTELVSTAHRLAAQAEGPLGAVHGARGTAASGATDHGGAVRPQDRFASTGARP